MLIDGKHVFPLNLIDAMLRDYYIDRSGTVFSGRSTAGRLVALAGSQQPSGRYFTLNKRSFGHADLIRRANAHPQFNSHMGTSQAFPVTSNPAAGNSKHSAANAVAKKKFLLATINQNDRLVFGSDPVFHDEMPGARAEAERVAQLTGNKVVVLQIVGAVQASKVTWE